MTHTCEIIYNIGANSLQYGEIKGICRITGKKSKGLFFDKWVKKTFNDFAFLKPGTIISNEALFCFDESSEIIKNKVNRDKQQRFRTYSHIVKNDVWYCLTKADKRIIYDLIITGAEIICLTETGQKHILFKHMQGFWQLDELFVTPDIELLKYLHANMCELMSLGFSQTEIIENAYKQHRINKCGLKIWHELESKIKQYRGTGIFDFTSFMLFTDEKQESSEPEKNPDESKQLALW